MLDNAMFLNVMKTIGIEVNDEIRNGKFSNLVIKKEEMAISMILTFPKVLTVDTIVFLRRRLSDFFVSDNMYNKIDIEFQYEDCTVNEQLMFGYYDFSTEITEEDKQGFQKTADFMWNAGMIEDKLDTSSLFLN